MHPLTDSMDEQTNLEDLRRLLAEERLARREAQQRAEEAEEREKQEKRQRREAEEREKQEKRQRREAEEREKQEKRQRREAEERARETTLEEYLRDCHLYIFKGFRIGNASSSSTGFATKVDGKCYPMFLRPWDDFVHERADHFARIREILGDRRLFPQSFATRHMTVDACRHPVTNEKGVTTFGGIAMESPVWRIFTHLLQVEPDICHELNISELRFTSNSRDLKEQGSDQSDVGSSSTEMQENRGSRPMKRIAIEKRILPPTFPDGLGMRTRLEGDKSLAFVYDYKAAHKLGVEDLKLALPKESLFIEVIQRRHGNKTLGERDKADQQVAMALTQVFDYMVQRGVAYGYATAGGSLVFLHVEQDDLRTLYYHLCVPSEEADVEGGGVEVCNTAVAQLASFCLLALQSEALLESSLAKTIENAKLSRWPEPYPEAAVLISAQDADSAQSAPSSQATDGSEFKSSAQPATRKISLRSGSRCRDAAAVRHHNYDDDDDDDDDNEDDHLSRASAGVSGGMGANKRKGGPSSSSSGSSDYEISSDSDSSPTRQYCTQACLLGLKRGWLLDEGCPNVSSHRVVASSTRHHIDAGKLTHLVGEQLRRNPYRGCTALDPYGFEGKIGSIGALFKVELGRYGYTLVGKGTQSAHIGRLRHEGVVYSRLEGLQGEVVPVHLGIVDLDKGYLLPGGALVMHLMLMSWGGEVAAGAGVADLAGELRRSSRAVWAAGVDHGDERPPNMLWNEERRRVMLVDFDRAVLRPGPKHKQLLKLSDHGRKRKLQGDILELHSRKRANGSRHVYY